MIEPQDRIDCIEVARDSVQNVATTDAYLASKHSPSPDALCGYPGLFGEIERLQTVSGVASQ